MAEEGEALRLGRNDAGRPRRWPGRLRPEQKGMFTLFMLVMSTTFFFGLG